MVFNNVVDRLLHLQRADRTIWLSDLRKALATVPAAQRFERKAFLRRIVLHDAFRRIATRLEMRFPRVSYRIAAAIPFTGPIEEARSTPPDRPIIIAIGHFNLFLTTFAAVKHAFGTRPVHVIHTDGKLGDEVAAYLGTIGAASIRSTESTLLATLFAMREDAHCVVIIAFDFLGRSAHYPVRFLGIPILAPGGLAYLADAAKADVYTCWFEVTPPRMRLAGPYQPDPDLTSEYERLMAFTQLMFSSLEKQIQKVPVQWNFWDTLAWSQVAARTRELSDSQTSPIS